MQEEILLKKYRTGTTITYFDTLISPENYAVSSTPGALYLNSMGMPYLLISSSMLPGNSAITSSNGVEIWKVSGSDNIQRLQEVAPGGRVLTGRSFNQDTERIITTSEFVQKSFLLEMQQKFSGQSESYVFVTPKVLDDFEVSFKIERTHDVLNTLSTYNKVYNDFPKRNAKTGVVFGKLEAVQKLKDENGNNIRIPLRGVPIGVFNSGNKFDSVTSIDDNGNRIRLNFKEVTNTQASTWPTESYYANRSSFSVDTEQYLQDKDAYLFNPNEPIVSMPEEFKYTVLTNENGEFIIHDVPTGPQVLMFEVDMLQQGLSVEEVALNFFPYRGENVSNIDEIPHFFFRQIPIDVIPAWGEIQSGYTEVNVKINLDLRKWATYYFPPACNKIQSSSPRFFDNGHHMKDEGDIDNVVLNRAYYVNNNGDWSAPQYSDVFFKVGDPYLSRYVPAPLVVEVRDMAREGFPKEGIQMVTVQNILERQGGELNAYAWVNEFSQIKDRAEFRTYGYNAIKLPANIYDPESYRTDNFGNPRSGMHQKGVWLSSYQFKMYHTSPNLSYRTTGFRITNWNNNVSRDHFHLNVNFQGITTSGITTNISADADIAEKQVPNFPYEKPWTINYPNRYSIPKKPSDIINPYSTSHNNGQYTVMEYPMYTDGHLIRLEGGHRPDRDGSVPTGGFGHSKMNNMPDTYIVGGWYSTSFCYSVTNSQLYHYEYGPWTDYGKYANGYVQGQDRFFHPNPYSGPLTVVFPTSTVKNGESYQRVEAGYGYYLHPNGMPRVGIKQGWGENALGMDYQCEYDTHRAAYGDFHSDAGYVANDSDFYFASWQYNDSIIFDGGHSTAIRMDYDEFTNYKRNQGAFSIYRIINPGSMLDPTQVYDLMQTAFITKKKFTLNLQRTIIQNEVTSNEWPHFRYDSTNANDFSDWSSLDPGRPGRGVPTEARITIANQGETEARVKLGTMEIVLAASEVRVITAQELNRSWHYLTIQFESNSDVKFENEQWVYKKFKYYISFDGITIPNHSWNGSQWSYARGMPYHKTINNDWSDGLNLYVWTQINGIKARKKCGTEAVWKYESTSLTTDGLYFGQGSNLSIYDITFRTTPLSSAGLPSCESNDPSGCFCGAMGGFYYGIV